MALSTPWCCSKSCQTFNGASGSATSPTTISTNSLNGDFSANDLRRFLFPDLATPLIGLSVFGGLLLLLWLLSTLEVGKVLLCKRGRNKQTIV